MHKKEAIDRLADSKLMTTTMTSKFKSGLNHGLRISHTNDQMNDRVDELTNKGWLKIQWVSAGSKQLIYELELIHGTLIIVVKEKELPKHTASKKPHGFSTISMVSFWSSSIPDGTCKCPTKTSVYLQWDSRRAQDWAPNNSIAENVGSQEDIYAPGNPEIGISKWQAQEMLPFLNEWHGTWWHVWCYFEKYYGLHG